MEITTLMFVLLKNMRNFSKNTNYGLLKEKFVKSNNIFPIFWQFFSPLWLREEVFKLPVG